MNPVDKVFIVNLLIGVALGFGVAFTVQILWRAMRDNPKVPKVWLLPLLGLLALGACHHDHTGPEDDPGVTCIWVNHSDGGGHYDCRE